MFRIDNATSTPGGAHVHGNCTMGSKVISSVDDTTGINIGDWLYILKSGNPTPFDVVNKGRVYVESKTVDTLTVNREADEAQVGIDIYSLRGYYTDGIPDLIARTVLNSLQLNCIQEEIANAITLAGGSLNKKLTTQLAAAFLKANGGTITGAVDIIANCQARKFSSDMVVNSGEADSGAALRHCGKVFNIADLAPATTKILTALSGVSNNALFGLKGKIIFTSPVDGLIYFSTFDVAARASASGPNTGDGYRTFLAPKTLPLGHSSSVHTTFFELWKFYELAYTFGDDTELDDDTNCKNQPLIILDRPGSNSTILRIKIRNPHLTAHYTNVKIILELDNDPESV